MRIVFPVYMNTLIFCLPDPPPRYDFSKRDGEFDGLRAQERKIEAQLEILKQQTEVLKEYSKTLKAADTDSSRLESFLDVYASRKNKIDDETAALNEKVGAIRKELSERREAVDEDEESVRNRGTRVTIVVSAESQGEVELSLTYVVTNASWTPQYDLRASVASDSKSQNSVALHYRASIDQQSGEDWSGVALTLSTASPLQGTNVPVLSPYWIGEKVNTPLLPPVPLRPKPTMVRRAFYLTGDTEAGASSAKKMKKQSADVRDSMGPVVGSAPPGFFRSRDSEATAGAVSTVFTIPGLSTIPSDSDSAQQTHKVSIAELQFDSVDLEWIAVPREIPSVFLQCRVKNTSKYVLLPGEANVFMNGSFVAKSSIPVRPFYQEVRVLTEIRCFQHVSPQESFPCSLGVDPAIRVTYHPRTTKSRTSGNGILTVKTDNTNFEQKITVKNTRLSNIPKLVVREQVPVSRDAKIKVAVLEPKGLQRGKENIIKEGIAIRWANWKAIEGGDLSNEASEDVDMESAQGMLEWICNIEPSASIDLTLAWEISAPSGVEWVKQ